MHLICIGITGILLERWTKFKDFKLDDLALKTVSHCLCKARNYWPDEYQRKPEGLNVLCSWKATQKRSFLLYLGPVVMRDVLPQDKLDHFHAFVTAAWTLICRVPYDSPQHDYIINTRTKEVDALISHFVDTAIHLYGGEISTLKFHALLHIVDDYRRFGPPDMWSAFRKVFLKYWKEWLTLITTLMFRLWMHIPVYCMPGNLERRMVTGALSL